MASSTDKGNINGATVGRAHADKHNNAIALPLAKNTAGGAQRAGGWPPCLIKFMRLSFSE